MTSDNHSWDIVTPEDLLIMLQQDFEDFQADPLSERKAIHCIIISWHLTDWTFRAYEKNNYTGIGEYREFLYLKCPELKIMHDIATRIKHFIISSPKSNLSGSRKNRGSFNRGFSFDFNVSCLKIKYAQKEICIDLILDKVIKMWLNYFNPA